MKTYKLRSGDLVTSKDGLWPTQYTNRTQAERAAAKIPGATVIVRGRPFYVKLPDIKCDKCRKVVGEVSTVTIQTCGQSFSSPAEYEDQEWCATCVNRAEYESDPDNAAYERALARGWAD